MTTQKNWWAPVRSGLVMDREAKHYRKMRNALWLFLYLLLNADRASGAMVRKIKTICADMGQERDTVVRWLRTLRRTGYIETASTGRCLSIQIQKWRKLGEVGNMPLQKLEESNTRGDKNPTSESLPHGSNDAQARENPPMPSDPIDISIKRSLLKNDIDNLKNMKTKSPTMWAFKPKSKEDLLALDLAKSLDDEKNLALYISVSRKYPEALLRKILGDVKEIPAHKIRKSRGALFNFLIQRHARKVSHHPGR